MGFHDDDLGIIDCGHLISFWFMVAAQAHAAAMMRPLTPTAQGGGQQASMDVDLHSFDVVTLQLAKTSNCLYG